MLEKNKNFFKEQFQRDIYVKDSVYFTDDELEQWFWTSKLYREDEPDGTEVLQEL